MPPITRLDDEAGRQYALARYNVLDSDPELRFDAITELIKSIFDVPMVAITLVDAERQWFKSRQGIDVAQTPRDVAFCHHTIQNSTAMQVPDALEDLRFRDNPLVTDGPYVRSYCGVPLVTPDGYNIGVICAIDTKPRVFHPAQVGMLTKFSAVVMAELELRQIASVDPLTGAMTRSRIYEAVECAIESQPRGEGQASCLALFDLDRFRRFNEQFGHRCGDAALSSVGSIARASIRDGDHFARLGADRFAVLMHGSGEQAGWAVCERICQGVGSMVLEDQPGAHLTARFGIAALAPILREPEQWFAAAEAKLAEARRAGDDFCVG